MVTFRLHSKDSLLSSPFKHPLTVVVLIFLRWIPESPRWLLANNRLDEAHSLLMKYAAKNGVNVDAKHLKHVISEVRKADVRKDDTRKYGTFDLFRTPKLRKRIIICCFNW